MANVSEKIIRTAVIGAGPAGLVATKCLTESNSGFECTTYEVSNDIGGTWVYTEKVGFDEYAAVIRTCMYRNLSTILPKEIMSLPGLPLKGNTEASYLRSEEVLKYLNEYADHFDLRKYIKLRHQVIEVVPTDDGRWKVSGHNFLAEKWFEEYFDAVVICCGVYGNPAIPRLPNYEIFQGVQFHSRDYKSPSYFESRKTLIVGGGVSAVDIAIQCSACTEEVYLSHHNERFKEIDFPSNVFQKPDVRGLTFESVIFMDESEVEDVDVIIYCTGYEHDFPFLHTSSCGIHVDQGVVSPVYKHFVNIEHPTMFFVGIPRDGPVFTMFNLQVQCLMKILKGESKLPSKEHMYAEFRREIDEFIGKKGSTKGYNNLRERLVPYYDWLTDLGNLPKVSRTVFEMYDDSLESMVKDIRNFRKYVYHVSDDKWHKTKIEKK